MKFLKFAAVALFVCAFASQASAGIPPMTVTGLSGVVDVGMGTFSLDGVSTTGGFTYNNVSGSGTTNVLTGSLDSNKSITITYTLLDLTARNIRVGAGGYEPVPSSYQAEAEIAYDLSKVGTPEEGVSDDKLIYAMASVEGPGKLQTVITNRSALAIDFESMINVFRVSGLGSFSVGYAIASVPLPPSVLLFAACLMALAGFSFYKKAYRG